ATAIPALLYVRVVVRLDEPMLSIAWPVSLAVDVAATYFIARIVFRVHPAVPFALLLALASDALAFLALAIFDPLADLHLARGALMMAAALGFAYVLRRARVRTFWPYILIAGSASWLALYLGGLHPALALIPIMPFLPHAARDPGFFVEASPTARDALSQFEVWWRYPAQAALFLFGVVNAGVAPRALEAGPLGMPIAVIVGRPLGVALGAGAALAMGFHLPQDIGWRELVVIGLAAAVGFSIGLFVSTALLPPGQLRSETNMGV